MLPQVFDSSEMCIVASLFCSTQQLAAASLQKWKKVADQQEEWHHDKDMHQALKGDRRQRFCLQKKHMQRVLCNVITSDPAEANENKLYILLWQHNSERLFRYCIAVLP